jgi:hypothetical protein
MKTAGTHHLIERTYRESGTFQWVRETYMNAIESGATIVEFGIEWQAVESLGVYRRVIADNGSGMAAENLVEFFNTFGGGGKPIGGEHENFGVGAKTSLLPWNVHGVVVVSWVDGEPSMIWVQRDPETGEYGLKVERTEDPDTGEESWESVYVPYEDPDSGCNWAAVKPDWLEDHGTVLVLLGDYAAADTVTGDPNRAEADIKGISAYLNRRLWTATDVEIHVDELRVSDRSQWPRFEHEAHGPQPKGGQDRRTNRRRIMGAQYYIEYTSTRGGKLAASGVSPISDGTKVNWYLWEGERSAIQSYAAISGYIGAVYKNELYDVTAHHSTYRTFGISEGDVRQRTWLVIEPPLFDATNGKHGVYPRTDRSSLLLKGGPNAGGPLPYNDWGNEFADAMPAELRTALKAARAGREGTIADTAWRERLAERFGARWRIHKLKAALGGLLTIHSTEPGTAGRPRPVKKSTGHSTGGGGGGGTGGKPAIGTTPGVEPAKMSSVGGGIPIYRFVKADAMGAGMLAAWQKNDPESPTGAVLINVEHPVLTQAISYWQDQYADSHADDVAQDVLDAYGQVAVAKVAHSEWLKSEIARDIVEKELRSDAALTMSLLGLIAEDALIAPRLGGKYRKRTVA